MLPAAAREEAETIVAQPRPAARTPKTVPARRQVDRSAPPERTQRSSQHSQPPRRRRRTARRLGWTLALLAAVVIAVVVVVLVAHNGSSSTVAPQKVIAQDWRSAIDQVQGLITKYTKQ